MNVWTVRELTSYIKGVLEGDFSLAGMSVSGELSNVKRAHNGHIWFTLKDEGAQLGAVMFKGDAMRCKLTPSEGMKVVASGRLTVYEPRGNYQMVVSDLRPDGLGDLYAAFLQRKEKLQAEGLFDAARKRAIPRYPTRVGIVTSEQGAALRDMLTTIRRRHPGVSVLLSPAVVQGADAPRSVVAALHRLCLAHAGGTSIDVIIVGRGGGSFEELNAFNDEDVARAIAGCPIPIVSGVGHETDFTIADLVADERAATPTAAAARVTPDREASLEAVSDLRGRLRRALVRCLERSRERLDGIERRRLRLSPGRLLDGRRQRLSDLEVRLETAVRNQVKRQEGRLGRLAGRLDALSPLQVLARGYVVCRSAEGEAVTRVEQAWAGRHLDLVLTDGVAQVTVEQASPRAFTATEAVSGRPDEREKEGKP